MTSHKTVRCRVDGSRGESALDVFSYGKIADLANGARGSDPDGYRAEYVRLVRMAEALGAVGAALKSTDSDHSLR